MCPAARQGAAVTTASIIAPAGITDAVPDNNVAKDTDLKVGDFDLQITHTDEQAQYTPGTTRIYSVVATNNGPSDVSAARITYQLPPGVTATYTAVYSGGAIGSGGEVDNDETVIMPAGSSITYTVTASISSGLYRAAYHNSYYSRAYKFERSCIG